MTTVPPFATPVDPERACMIRDTGPSCIPVRSMFGGISHPSGASYGRYLTIDLDENNSHSIDAWCERNPGRPRPILGWGVCRHGFGLQDDRDRSRELGHPLTEADADAWACELNAAITIGVY